MDDNINLDDLFDDDFDDYINNVLSDSPEIIENIEHFIDANSNFIDANELSSSDVDEFEFERTSSVVESYKIDLKNIDLLNDQLLKESYLNENINKVMETYDPEKLFRYKNSSEEFYEWAKNYINSKFELRKRLELLGEYPKEGEFPAKVEYPTKSEYPTASNEELKYPSNNLIVENRNKSGSPDLFMMLDDEIEKNQLTISDNIQFRRIEIIAKIEEIVKMLLQNLVSCQSMEIFITDRSKWNNFEMHNGILSLTQHATQRKVSTKNSKSKFRFTLIIYLLSEIYELLINCLTCTLRELYYRDPILYEKMVNLNNALKDICCYLNVAPWELGIYSASKGLIAGSLSFILPNNDIIDCSELNQNGTILPLDTAYIELLNSNAEFILIVEKDTVFERLLRNNILLTFSKDIILITGKGYPDINTRLMINKIWKKFHIPIYALVDADPFGIDIMFTYRYGSKAMSYNGDYLTCPKLQWIGIHPSEIDLLGLPSIPLTKEDHKKITELLQRPYLKDDVRKELEILQKTNKKAEIEAVSSFSLNFLINDYIANKVKTKLFI